VAPLIPIAISLASKFAPMLIDRLAGNTAGKVAEQVIGIAQKISGKADPQEAHDEIMANPELHVEFEKASMNLEIEIAREQTKQLLSQHLLMKEELKAGGIKGFWRPYNGILFGTTLFLDYMIMPFLVLWINVNWATIEACKAFTMPHIPMPVYVFWGLVLGVNGYTRGKEKLEKIKQSNGGSPDVLGMVKMFTQGAIGM